MESSEEREQRFRALRESIVAQLLVKYPDITFDRHKYGVDIVYYVVSYSDGAVRTRRRTRSIYTTVPNLDSYFLTKSRAVAAITEYVPAAVEKFQRCVSALDALKASLGFDVSYVVEGDTHGVDDDYQYLSFEMGGFSFVFRI